MDDKMSIATAVVFIALALALSYVFARAGHPNAHWTWCTMGRLC